MAQAQPETLYRTDFYAWTRQQAAELRRMAERRVNSALDLENLAEEVEALGKIDWHAVRSQVRRIIEHCLKLEHSPASEPRWESQKSIIEGRDEIADRLTASLRQEVQGDLAALFTQARRRAAGSLRAHGEHEAAGALPTTCPYAFDEIVRHDWYPASRHGLADPADALHA